MPGQIAQPVTIGLARAHKTSEMPPDFLGARILPCKKGKKTFDLKIFSQVGEAIKNLQ